MNRERTLSWQAAVILPLAAGYFGALLSLALSGAHVPAAAASAPAATTTSAIATPARLTIPAIGVDTAVESVGLAKTGTGDIGTPSNFLHVAWYNQSPAPGSPGISIIDGHLDGRYVPQAVFYHLGDLTLGNDIYVTDHSGVKRHFVVTETELLASTADTSALFSNSGTPQLVLITCAGDWLPDKHEYTDRVVVFATLAP